MPHEPFDDEAIDALLAGSTPDAGSRAVGGFVNDVRAAAEAVPTPSPALAAAIAAGGISTEAAPSKWKQVSMKIQAALAGLGIAGKIALGVGVAAAATTGAGAAGVLPGPVQHAMARAVDAVSPFTIPDPGQSGNDGGVAAGEGETTTTIAGTTATTEPGDHGAAGAGDSANGETTTTVSAPAGDGNGGVAVTPTTEASGSHDGNGGAGDTPSTEPSGSHDGNGGDGHDGNTTPTTEHHDGGDNPNPQSIALECHADGAAISCSWNASPGADHAKYVLLRVGDDHNRVVFQSADGLSFTDANVTGGMTYGYRVVSLRADGSVEAHSNFVSVTAAGAPTPTTEHHGGDGGGGGDVTTTTEAHHS